MPLQSYCFTFSSQLRELFGCRVQKVALDAGFSCPNRDGTLHSDGCIFCNNAAFSPASRNPGRSLLEQLYQGMENNRRKYKAKKFIAYFQAYTNTYGPIHTLKQRYDVIRKVDHVVGLSVSTRPDCIDQDKLDLLESYSHNFVVWIEYGLQSIHQKSLRNMNRGHTLDDFVKAIELTRSRKIRICVHLILGLPGETLDDMMATADFLARLPIDSVKIHVLHILSGTRLEQDYLSGRVTLPGLSEYAAIVVAFLERLPAGICIQRFTADAYRPYLIAPLWLETKRDVLLAIEGEFEKRGSCQGSAFRARELV